MDTTLFSFVLYDELRIHSDAMESLFTMGVRHARSFHHPDNHEFEESPQNEWLTNLQIVVAGKMLTDSLSSKLL